MIKDNIWELTLIVGLILITVGIWLISPIAALIFIGASMVLISLYVGMRI